MIKNKEQNLDILFCLLKMEGGVTRAEWFCYA